MGRRRRRIGRVELTLVVSTSSAIDQQDISIFAYEINPESRDVTHFEESFPPLQPSSVVVCSYSAAPDATVGFGLVDRATGVEYVTVHGSSSAGQPSGITGSIDHSNLSDWTKFQFREKGADANATPLVTIDAFADPKIRGYDIVGSVAIESDANANNIFC